MEPDITNMTLNEYLMYQRRHRDLERSCTSRKSVAPVSNRILVYPDSNEEDEEYCSMHPLLPYFQTPQPCAIFNFVHHNSHSEVDIDNITLEEYARCELEMSTMKSETHVPTQDDILDDLFGIRTENIRKIEHEVPNMCDDITNYEDSDQEDGELTDLPTFSATDVFASVCEHVDIDISIAREKEDVSKEDVEMDEDHKINHSMTNNAFQ
ncbi:hypothetical protein Tco_1569546 [Tanacetum coccineum]